MGKMYQKKDGVINYSGSHAVVKIFEKRRRRNIYYLFSVGETLNVDFASQATPHVPVTSPSLLQTAVFENLIARGLAA